MIRHELAKTRFLSSMSPRGAARSEDPEEPTHSAFAHETHFLSRTLRCEGEDQLRAMRMYHHSGLMRKLVPALLADYPDEPRAAIALRDGPPSPHAIVTRDGRFVTCLDETMEQHLRVLPYAVIEQKIEEEDQARGLAERARRQIRKLPIEQLGQAIMGGYGRVTREMIEILLIEPTTYIYAAFLIFLRVYDTWARLGQALPFHPEPKEVQRRQLKLGAALRMCLPLLGTAEDVSVTEYLADFLSLHSTLEIDVIAALCRHRAGGEALLKAAELDSVAPRTRELIVSYIGNHFVHFPEQVPALLPRVRALPQMAIESEHFSRMRVLYDELLAGTAEEQIALFRGQRERPLPQPIPLSRTFEITRADYFQTVHAYFPVTEFFPPAAVAGEARGRWAAHVQRMPLPPRPRTGIRPALRAGPKLGRNDPCSCGSGRKHKHCCASGAAAPQPAQQEGAPAQ